MRIIAGKFKGRKLDFPKGPDIRPTQDRVREALFNVIAQYVAGARVLDLFSGSGALGIEALSRKAKDVTFVDNNPKCISIIKSNLANINIKLGVNILKMDVLKAINILSQKGKVFDIIFLDPPYHSDLLKKTLIKLSQYDIVSQNNLIIAEHFKKGNLTDTVRGISRYTQKQYGDTMLSFYRKIKA